ncbi:hypothetical protein A2U01_0069572, partial [Trifolium medium]|nr:hypothetical protein [Trifolium medium]
YKRKRYGNWCSLISRQMFLVLAYCESAMLGEHVMHASVGSVACPSLQNASNS